MKSPYIRHEQMLMDQRAREFDVLYKESHENPAINNIINNYAKGMICTREEALFQMVKVLSVDWDEARRRQFEAARTVINDTIFSDLNCIRSPKD